jgi:hypothetical protein
MTDKPDLPTDPDPDYLGNVWGWKFSLIGLAVIVFFLALITLRWYQLGKPSLKGPPQTEEAVQDSAEQEGEPVFE